MYELTMKQFDYEEFKAALDYDYRCNHTYYFGSIDQESVYVLFKAPDGRMFLTCGCIGLMCDTDDFDLYTRDIIHEDGTIETADGKFQAIAWGVYREEIGNEDEDKQD